MSKWIDLEDRFPEDHVEVLFCSYIGSFYVGFAKYGETFDDDGRKHDDFVKWLPIPDWQ